jgi:hypothetical protein
MPRRFSVVLFTLLLLIVFLLSGTLTGAAESIVVQSAPMLQTTDNAYCVGNDLHVDLTPRETANTYRVAGSGPNLPSSSYSGPSGVLHTFVIGGPGAWSGLFFEYTGPTCTTGWCLSGFAVSPTSITCGSTEPPPTDEPPVKRPTTTPVPGCDVTVYMPSTVVNGLFLDNAAVFWKPGSLTNPIVVIEAGKTYRVDGLDESGVYRKVLISCTWAWVQADKVGPDPTAPWYGKPLPNHVTS